MTKTRHKIIKDKKSFQLSKPQKRNIKPRKTSQAGSLFTALNLPVFVPLLRLPPEIRNRIWTYSLRSDNGIVRVNEEENFPEPAFLKTCKAIRREATGLFYSENKFLATVTSYSPKMPIFMSEKMLSLTLAHNCLIQHLSFALQGPPRWHNLLQWLRFIRDSGLHTLMYGHSMKDMFLGAGTSRPTRRQVEEHFFVRGLFVMVFMMQREEWKIIEAILEGFRMPLSAFNPKWAVDQVGDTIE